jgi:hypothetical protein
MDYYSFIQGLECGMIPENAINLPHKRPHQFKTLAMKTAELAQI